MFVRTTALALARWLERAGGNWQVDGEPSLKHLPQPTPAHGLAAALRKRVEELAVLAPAECPFPEGAIVGERDLVRAAHDISGSSVFQLAWIGSDGVPGDSWLVAEHASMTDRRLDVTQSGSAMIELLRKELSSGEPRIDDHNRNRLSPPRKPDR